MITELNDVSEKALSLLVQERAFLAKELIGSLEGFDDGNIEQAWEHELQERKLAIPKGETTASPALEALNEIRAKFSR